GGPRYGGAPRAPPPVPRDVGPPPVEPVGDGPGQRAKDQRRQQRSEPDAADRRALRRLTVAGQVVGQRADREEAQPVPQAGQGERDPQPAEGPDGQHTTPAPAQRGCKVHGVRVSADRPRVPAAAKIRRRLPVNPSRVPPSLTSSWPVLRPISWPNAAVLSARAGPMTAPRTRARRTGRGTRRPSPAAQAPGPGARPVARPRAAA